MTDAIFLHRIKKLEEKVEKLEDLISQLIPNPSKEDEREGAQDRGGFKGGPA